MSIRSYLDNNAETRELHPFPKLRSKYYKTNYNKCKEQVLEYIKGLNAELRNIDEEHKEIFVQGRNFHMIFSFVQVNPIETSIDIKVEKYGLMGMHKPRKQIIEAYAFLDQRLPFKGVSLHP